MAKLRKKKPALGNNPEIRVPSLRKLVAKITKENRHPEILIGPEWGRGVVEYVEPHNRSRNRRIVL